MQRFPFKYSCENETSRSILIQSISISYNVSFLSFSRTLPLSIWTYKIDTVERYRINTGNRLNIFHGNGQIDILRVHSFRFRVIWLAEASFCFRFWTIEFNCSHHIRTIHSQSFSLPASHWAVWYASDEYPRCEIWRIVRATRGNKYSWQQFLWILMKSKYSSVDCIAKPDVHKNVVAWCEAKKKWGKKIKKWKMRILIMMIWLVGSSHSS